jgi:hypothetical protein
MIVLSEDYRIRVYDDLQWVLERRDMVPRRGFKPAGERWRIIAYCRSRAGLETAVSRLKCEYVVFTADRHAEIAKLPEWFPETEPKHTEAARSVIEAA